MNQKKAFSYLMWFLYSISVCVCLLSIAGTLSKRAGYSHIVGYGVIGLWLVLSGLLVFLVSMLVRKFYFTKESGKMSALITESLTVVILFAVGSFIRIGGVFSANGGTDYFELAKVVEGQSVPAVSHGAVSVYLYLLHFLFRLLGNQFFVGIWMQIILQMIAGFFCYRAVRKLGGVIASVITLGFIMIGPTMISESLVLSPEMLFLAIYAIVLYLCACCIRGKKGPVSCLFTGIAVAVVCYLDIMGITLLLMMIVGLLQKKSENERPLSGRLIGALLGILGCAVGFTLMVLFNSLINAKEFGDVFSAWLQLFRPVGFKLPPMLDVTNPSAEVLCLLLTMTLGVFSFWCCFDNERQSIWIWLTASLILIQGCGMTNAELGGQLNLYILFAVLAGAGVANMFAAGEESDEDLEDDENSDDSSDKIHETEVIAPVSKKIVREPVGEDAKPKSVVIRIPANPGEKPVVKEQVTPMKEEPKKEDNAPKEEVAPVEEAEPPKVKFIENPLPLPKKHVKKTLDYDLTDIAGQEDFDFDVADDDDFDI